MFEIAQVIEYKKRWYSQTKRATIKVVCERTGEIILGVEEKPGYTEWLRPDKLYMIRINEELTDERRSQFRSLKHYEQILREYEEFKKKNETKKYLCWCCPLMLICDKAKRCEFANTTPVTAQPMCLGFELNPAMKECKVCMKRDRCDIKDIAIAMYCFGFEPDMNAIVKLKKIG